MQKNVSFVKPRNRDTFLQGHYCPETLKKKTLQERTPAIQERKNPEPCVTMLLHSISSCVEKFEEFHNDKDKAGDGKKYAPLLQ